VWLDVGRDSEAYCAGEAYCAVVGGLRFADPPYYALPPLRGHATGHVWRRRFEDAAAASRKVWIFQRSGGAGASLHTLLFKGYANVQG